jgi:hypothetical protein
VQDFTGDRVEKPSFAFCLGPALNARQVAWPFGLRPFIVAMVAILMLQIAMREGEGGKGKVTDG